MHEIFFCPRNVSYIDPDPSLKKRFYKLTEIMDAAKRGVAVYLLNDRITALETPFFFMRESLACFVNSRSGSIESGEVCAHEVSNSLNGTKKKI